MPLGPDELKRATLTGDRLRGCLLDLISRSPSSRGSALSMARETNLDRNVTQKVFAATAPGIEGVAVLMRAPGPGALRAFVAAASAGESALGTEALAAIDQFEVLIRDLGGSQSRLNQRLLYREAETGDGEEDRELRVRERLFNDTSELMGMRCEVLPFIGMARPVPSNPGQIEGVAGFGLMGMAWKGGPLPIKSQAMVLDSTKNELSASVEVDPLYQGLADREGLVAQFSTEPLPQVSRQHIRGLEVVTIDPASDRGGRVDLAFAHRWGNDSNPMMRETVDERFWSQFVSIRRPTRRLVFDVYLHRTLARACVPYVGAYRWAPGVATDPLRAWNERLPGRIQLELLGPGLSLASSPAWSKHEAFARYLFERSAWSAEEFIGYRIDVMYPIWNAGYYVTFDFRPPPE